MIGKKNDLIKWLLEAPDKEYELKEHRKSRSLNANAYFHVLCQKIAEATKQSLIEVKNQLICGYGYMDTEVGCVILKDGIEWKRIETIHLMPTTSTRTMDDGKLWRVYRVMRGSHTYDTKEMAHLIDMTVEEAKGLDIETLPPHELERLKEAWNGEHTSGRK